MQDQAGPLSLAVGMCPMDLTFPLPKFHIGCLLSIVCCLFLFSSADKNLEDDGHERAREGHEATIRAQTPNRDSRWVVSIVVIASRQAIKLISVLFFARLHIAMMRLVLALSLPLVAMATTHCVSPNNVFHVKVNLFAGELGTCHAR